MSPNNNPSSSTGTHYVSALGFMPASSDLLYEEPFIHEHAAPALYQANLLYNHSQKPSTATLSQQETQQMMLLRKKQLSIDVKQQQTLAVGQQQAPLVLLQQQYYNSGATPTTSTSGQQHPRTGSLTSSAYVGILQEETKQRPQNMHPQNIPRGGIVSNSQGTGPSVSSQQKGGYQPSHIPKKKSIPQVPNSSSSHHGHSTSIGSTYKPSNLALLQSNSGQSVNNQRNSIGAGSATSHQEPNPYNSLGVRSKSLSGQQHLQQSANDIQNNQQMSHFKNSVSMGTPPIIQATSNVVLHATNPSQGGIIYQQPLQGQLAWIQTPDQQKAQQYIVLNNGQQILVADPSTTFAIQQQEQLPQAAFTKKTTSSEFAQHSIQRLQRYEQLQQKQKMAEAKITVKSIQGNNNNGPSYQGEQVKIATNQSQNPQINNFEYYGQEALFNPSPQMNPYMTQFSNNSNKLSLQGSNIQSPIIGVSNQSLMFESNDSINNLQLHSLALNPQQTLQAHQLQTQSSNYSSSGNISSSWLSQSNGSFPQMKASPQSVQPLILQNKHEANCQCTSCLKSQMAQLQQLLHQQSQMFFQHQQQPLKQHGFPIASSAPLVMQQPQNTPYLNPTGNNAATLQNQSSSGNLQNQSSSCWASSNSQLSPHSQSRSQTINSSMRQSEADINLLEPPSQTASMDCGDMRQDSKIHGKTKGGKTRGNEDETIVEDHRRLSENNSDEESGSIPDEIEQLRNYADQNHHNQYNDPCQMQFMYQHSEVVVDSTKKPRNKGITQQQDEEEQRYFERNNDGSSGDTNNFNQQPQYWIPAQLPQNIQSQINVANQGNGTQRKNYIELPMGEIPEMKESFYDDHSRWSQVFAGTANQSRTKTPSGNNQSQQNLHADQSSNINNSNSTSNKGDNANGGASSKLNQLTEEEKEDLFLYSQGESGATFNRTENESSFLTSEKNKINQFINRGPAQPDPHSDVTQVKVPGQSPSFEALKELSMSKSLEKMDVGKRIQNDEEPQYISAKKEQNQNMNNRENIDEEYKMGYPETIDKKKLHAQIEYSASSAKYLNQSLTLTPSQYQTQDDPNNNMNSSMYEQEQKSFPHMTLQYDQLTPIKNRDQQSLPTLEDEVEQNAYQYLINQAVVPSKESHQHTLSVDCKFLDEGEIIGAPLISNRRSISNIGHTTNHNESLDTQANQREIILSPLPPLPLSLEGTPDANAIKRMKNHSQLSNQFPLVQIIQDQPQVQASGQGLHNSGRQSSISYEKERANKIINYILNSDQKSSTYHLQNMRSSVLSRDSGAHIAHHHHRSNIISQVNNIFPNLDDMEKELRTQQKQLAGPEEKVLSIELETIKPQAQEEVLMWSASVSSTPKNLEVTDKIGPSYQTQPVSSKKQKSEDLSSASKKTSLNYHSQVQNTSSNQQIKARDASSSQNGTRYTMIDIKGVQQSSFQSRNIKSQTQKLPGSTKKQVSVLDNNINSYTQRHAQHRIRSLDIDRNLIQERRKFSSNGGTNNAQRQNKSDERSAAQANKSSRSNIDSKSPFVISEKQKISKLTPLVQQQFRNQKPTNDDNSRNRASNSPYMSDKNKQIFGALKQQSQNSFAKQNQYATSFQNRTLATNKIIQAKKASQQNPIGNQRQYQTQSQLIIAPNKTQVSNQGVSKYLPSMFDRLKSKQVFAASQRVPNLHLHQNSVTDESLSTKLPNTASANFYNSKTQRNDSAKSRPSQERPGGETRNSSRSSGANCSGNRKRKFSKIVFEISELPTTQSINRSLSYKRQKEQFMRLNANAAKISIQEQIAIKNKVEREQKSFAFNSSGRLSNKISISPKRQTMPPTSSLSQGIHLMPVMGSSYGQGMPKANDSNSRSYNSSSEFIVTHENFQIRQMTTEETALPTESYQETAPNRSTAAKQAQNTGGNGPMQLQIQIQSRNQRSIGRQSQTEVPVQNQPRVQNFVIETSQAINPEKSSKAIVQSLLTNNDNVSSQLSKLFGSKHKSKDSTSILSTDVYNEDSSHFYKQKQKSPVNPYQLLQKQPSPKMRYTSGAGNSHSGQSPFISPAEEVKKKINYVSSTQQQKPQIQTKVCLPNSIFFNSQPQQQKQQTSSITPQNASHMQLIKKAKHIRGNALNQ